MKIIKWKIFSITSAVCLSPVLLGLALWNKLPDTMAIHFNINNEPDNFAPKWFVVFGLPLIMVLLQAFCCIVNDLNAHKHGERKKLSTITKWIIPIMSIVLQIMTLGIGLDMDFDVRVIVNLIVGIVLILVGNYMPKFDYIKNYDIDTEKARKINRFIGFGSVIMGLLFIISIFLPPIASVVCIFLLIPYAVISVIYGIAVGRKK